MQILLYGIYKLFPRFLLSTSDNIFRVTIYYKKIEFLLMDHFTLFYTNVASLLWHLISSHSKSSGPLLLCNFDFIQTASSTPSSIVRQRLSHSSSISSTIGKFINFLVNLFWYMPLILSSLKSDTLKALSSMFLSATEVFPTLK